MKHDSTIPADGESAPPSKNREEKRLKWEKPCLEDVSGKVMAQPYIRFT